MSINSIFVAQALEQEPICHYCRDDLFFGKASADHVIPLSHGGTDNFDNLVLSCVDCNHLKGSMSYDIFVNIVSCVEDRISFNEQLQLKSHNITKEKMIEMLVEKQNGVLDDIIYLKKRLEKITHNLQIQTTLKIIKAKTESFFRYQRQISTMNTKDIKDI